MKYDRLVIRLLLFLASPEACGHDVNTLYKHFVYTTVQSSVYIDQDNSLFYTVELNEMRARQLLLYNIATLIYIYGCGLVWNKNTNHIVFFFYVIIIEMSKA